MTKTNTIFAIIALGIMATNADAQSTSDLSHYYIGIDNNPIVGFGDYTGNANPNQNRVTMLFNHYNLTTVENSHYHPIGSYSLTGDTNSPTEVPTNGNNRLPETYTGLSLQLAAAPTGSPYEGMLISGMGAGSADAEYGNLEIRQNTSLTDTDGYGPTGQAGTTPLGNAAYYMYTRDTQNFTLALDNLDLEMELVDVTPGLAIGDANGNTLMDEVGDTAPLFVNSGSFTPTFYTAGDAAPGVYSASFLLNDNSGTYMSGGTFHFDFTVVPEPTSMLLMLAGVGALLVRRF